LHAQESVKFTQIC